jgi:hypothetical protein
MLFAAPLYSSLLGSVLWGPGLFVRGLVWNIVVEKAPLWCVPLCSCVLGSDFWGFGSHTQVRD